MAAAQMVVPPEPPTPTTPCTSPAATSPARRTAAARLIASTASPRGSNRSRSSSAGAAGATGSAGRPAGRAAGRLVLTSIASTRQPAAATSRARKASGAVLVSSVPITTTEIRIGRSMLNAPAKARKVSI